MTDSEIIIEVAKLDGWTHVNQSWISPNESRYADRVKRRTSDSPLEIIPLEQILPEYLTSRDAIIPVIQKLCSIPNHEKFGVELVKMLGSEFGNYPTVFDFVTAYPEKLCIALLKATGKWKD